jgi:response regulator of citrate/malate metabolism
MFGFERKLRKDQFDYLSRIKPLLQTNFEPNPAEKNKEFLEINDFIAKLDKLAQRVNAIEEKIEENKEEGVRKVKVKEQILSLLEQRKKLSSSELSNLINLSRTRCSEYFRELSKEGLSEGIIVGRQKYYKLVRK